MGGPYSLRGYNFFRVGKTRFSQKTYENDKVKERYPIDADRRLYSMKPYGGTKQLYYQTELEFPMIIEAGIKGVFFYDIGQAEDEI